MVGPGASGAGSGVVIGIATAFLAWQFGYLDLGMPSPGLLYLVAFIVVGAIVFGIIGAAIGRRYLRKHRPVVAWRPGPAAPPDASSGSR